MNDFKEVTRAELDEFVRSYPRKLERDVFMACEPPLVTWNDFERAPKWPDSVVASATGDQYKVIADIDSIVPDDGSRDTDAPLVDNIGTILQEGDEVMACWGWSSNTGDIKRKEKIMIRDRGTKYECWSFESCHNLVRGFDTVKIDSKA